MRKIIVVLILLLTFKTAFSANPVIDSVIPATGNNDEITKITISGQNFDTSCIAYIIPDALNPNYISIIDTPGYVKDVCVSGNYAYVADGSCGLQVIDISDPLNPFIKGSADTPGTAVRVCVEDGVAYIADSTGLCIIDVSDPANPIRKADLSIPGTNAVFTVKKYAYTGGTAGFQVIDVNDPLNPVLNGSINNGGSHPSINNIHISGYYAHIAGYTGQYGNIPALIDVSYPLEPLMVELYVGGHFTVPKIQDVFVSGNYEYIVSFPMNFSPNGNNFDQLGIIDRSIIDRNNEYIQEPIPFAKKSLPVLSKVSSIYISGNYAYISSLGGIFVYDVKDPSNINFKTKIPENDTTEKIFVLGNYIYAACGGTGLKIIHKKSAIGELNITYIDPGTITADVPTRMLPGDYSVAVRNSSDGEGVLHNSFTILQGPSTNNAPVINALTDKAVNENDSLVFTVSGSDPDADAVFFEAPEIPNGAYLNANTGVFTWVPTYLQAGVHDAILGIYDGELFDTVSMKITVNNVNRPPVVTLNANETAGVCPLTVSFSAIASDQDIDGSIMTYEWDFDGDWNYENAGTDTESFIFNKYGTFNVNVRVTDNDGATAETGVAVEVVKSISEPAGNIDAVSPGSETRIDGHDLYVLKRAFGSIPGDLNWNPLTDLDGDLDIDGDDLVILASGFGG